MLGTHRVVGVGSGNGNWRFDRRLRYWYIDRRSQTLTVKMQIRHSGTEQIPKFFAAKKLGWQFFLQVPRNVYDQNAIAPLEH